MMKRAFEGTECEALENCLEGPSAIAISKDDATAPARILCKFAKDAPALELKGGVVEGALRLRLRQSNIGTDAHLYGAEARAGGAGNADKTAGRIGMMPAA